MQINTNSVSFGSNYKIMLDSRSADKTLPLYAKESDDFHLYSECYYDDKELQQWGGFGYLYVCADDSYDKQIENFLASSGVDFQKKSFDKLLDLDEIKSRIKISDTDKSAGNKLVEIDTENFDILYAQDEDFYVGKNGKGGSRHSYDSFGDYLKSGLGITASRVVISETEDEIRVNFLDGRHRYAYMRDMGMSKIPISLDDESITIAKKYGLLPDDLDV